MDPAVLDDLDIMVPDLYPQVRSVLVVRHGYLVYERYGRGVDAGDGDGLGSFSVTGSFISALVGDDRIWDACSRAATGSVASSGG